VTPTEFPEVNITLTGAPGSGVLDLPTYRDEDGVVSCWRMSWRERIAALWYGRVWFHASAQTHPPIYLQASKGFFLSVALLFTVGTSGWTDPDWSDPSYRSVAECEQELLPNGWAAICRVGSRVVLVQCFDEEGDAAVCTGKAARLIWSLNR
jgi:hypothetical protein